MWYGRASAWILDRALGMGFEAATLDGGAMAVRLHSPVGPVLWVTASLLTFSFKSSKESCLKKRKDVDGVGEEQGRAGGLWAGGRLARHSTIEQLVWPHRSGMWAWTESRA